jgi:transcriptional regulator CtsR
MKSSQNNPVSNRILSDYLILHHRNSYLEILASSWIEARINKHHEEGSFIDRLEALIYHKIEQAFGVDSIQHLLDTLIAEFPEKSVRLIPSREIRSAFHDDLDSLIESREGML